MFHGWPICYISKADGATPDRSLRPKPLKRKPRKPRPSVAETPHLFGRWGQLSKNSNCFSLVSVNDENVWWFMLFMDDWMPMDCSFRWKIKIFHCHTAIRDRRMVPCCEHWPLTLKMLLRSGLMGCCLHSWKWAQLSGCFRGLAFSSRLVIVMMINIDELV